MRPIAIIYGSSGDNTKSVAEKISTKFPDSTLIDVSNLKVSELDSFDNLILGTSTWGMGDLQDDWDGFLPELKKANLDGKTIALFGLGDSYSYSDSFVDSMGIIYEAIKDKGCTIIGSVSKAGYSFDASRAYNGSEFVGLPLDEDNEFNLTESRINDWVDTILPLFP